MKRVALLLALAAVACGAAAEDEPTATATAAVGEGDVARMRVEVEVLSGARSESCAVSGPNAPGCRVLRSADERTFSRYAGSDSSQARLSRATSYVCERFGAALGVPCDVDRASGVRVVMQRFRSNDREQANVVAVIPGTAPERPVTVVGAHHDSTTTELGPAPGAMDNASGVAILLELARGFAAAPPAGTVILAAFAAEEGQTHATGSDGSRHYVTTLTGGGCERRGAGAIPCASRVGAMLNLDMLALPRLRRVGARLEPFPGGAPVGDHVRLFAKPGTEACVVAAAGDSVHQALGRALTVAARESGAGIAVRAGRTSDRVTQGFARFSDHFSFHEAGIPAVRLIGPQAVDDAGLNHSAFDRTSRPVGAYEASMADADQILDWEYLARASRLVMTLTRSLASGLDGPRPRVEGAVVSWDAVPGAAGYLVALRKPRTDPNEHTVSAGDVLRVTGTQVAVPPGYRTVAVAAIAESGLVGRLSREATLGGACTDLAPPACASPFTADCDD
jgi:Zn-dependent M28 family amino/carboxypeptidase